MGFFSSGPTKQDVNETYNNPELRQYTNAYRGAAPWGFATLDPTATLAAMGKSTSIGTASGDINFGGNTKRYLQGLSADEKQQRLDTNEALARIKQRQESGQFLTPQETEFINTSLDKAFEYAHNIGYADWQRGAQSLAGGRGLRTSDTPVAQPAMQELRNFELGLGSKRAELGLNATMQMGQQQNEFDKAFAEFNQTLSLNRWNARQGYLFGGGMQAASMLGYNRQTHTETTAPAMTGFQKIMSGIGLTSSLMQLPWQGTGLTGAQGMSVGGVQTSGTSSPASGLGSVMSGIGGLAASDRRLKTNIVRVGTHKLGIGIYTYILQGKSSIGVMADEVRLVKPEAVIRYADGYDRVNYSLL